MNEEEKGNIRADLEKIVFQNNLFNSSLNTIFEKLHTAHEFLENKINDDKLKIRNLEQVKSKVQAFSYKKEDKKNLAEKVNGFMEAIDNERNKKIILGEEISKLQSEINNSNLDIINKKDLVNGVVKMIFAFLMLGILLFFTLSLLVLRACND